MNDEERLLSSENPLSGNNFCETEPKHGQNFKRKNIIKKKQRKKQISLIVGIAIFLIFNYIPFLNQPSANSCLAILVLACYLWIFEVIPSFATSYLITFLGVVLRVGVDKKTNVRMKCIDLSIIFSQKFTDPVIFVFLSSMVMSMALQKLNITSRISSIVFELISSNPKIILLVLMFLNVTLGTFISNIASTTLTLSIAIPVIKCLPPNDDFIKAILFGVAWSGNCAGMPSPIASPQNIIASNIVAEAKRPISFLTWFIAAAPVSYILCFFQWCYLIYRFPACSRISINLYDNGLKDKWTGKHTQTVIVSLITILLWSISHIIEPYLGNMAIISLIPIIWLFSFEILDKNDFLQINWSTLILTAGGLVLGELMKISGLLDIISDKSQTLLKHLSFTKLMVIILSCEGIMASLLSSTTSASIAYPLILAIGKSSNCAHSLVILSSLMISSAQLFHISSFPNTLVSAVYQESNSESQNKNPYLSAFDYVKYGWPTLILAVLVISSLGYSILFLLGF